MSANGRLALVLVLIAVSSGMIVPLGYFGFYAPLCLLIFIPLFTVIVMVLKPRR